MEKNQSNKPKLIFTQNLSFDNQIVSNRLLKTVLRLCCLIILSFSCTLFDNQVDVIRDQSPETTIEAPSSMIPPAEIDENDCTFYASPDGIDEADGSREHPWGNFEVAADQADVGDVVCFMGGTYPMDTTLLTNSGDPDGMITFAAYPGDIPVLDGGGESSGILIITQGVSYVRVSGFALRNFTDWGIELSGENRHIQLDQLDISGGEASVRMTYGDSEEPPMEGPVEDILIEDSVLQGSEYTALDCTPGPCNRIIIRRLEVFGAGIVGAESYGSDGISISTGRDITIEDCYVHDNAGDGIDLNSRDRQGNVPGILVTRNRVVRNHLNGIKTWAGGRIENNLLWGQGNSALWVGTHDSTIEIINNTVAYNMWDTAYSARNWVLAAGYPEDNPRPEVNLTLVNNIFAFNADPLEGGSVGIYLGPGVSLNEHHNLYYSRVDGEITAEYITGRDTDFTRLEIADGIWSSLSGGGNGNLVSDPMFVSGWSDVDLHLIVGSIAIDAGDAQFAPSYDLGGVPRDEMPDLGAYELR
jgi:hypothetical protein